MLKEISAFTGLEEWLVSKMGRSLKSGFFEYPAEAYPESLLAYRIGKMSMLRTIEKLSDEVRSITNSLSEDELFSIFGSYELSRATLPHGVSVFGPNFYYFGDAGTFKPCEKEIAVLLSKEEVFRMADSEIFWHCDWKRSSANFGIIENNKLVALTTVWPLGGPVYEIGIDVAPKLGLSGLGRIVMSAACRWILDREGLILARSAQWNIPSVRLLRSIGLRYTLSDLTGNRGPFKVPPQPLGKPLPGDGKILDLYPIWAQNRDIIRVG